MPNIFSIVRHIDIEVLDRKIDDWFAEHGYGPIILMSPDTLKEIMENFGLCISRNACNNCTGRVGTYQGAKVFSDPSMKYGEVELR